MPSVFSRCSVYAANSASGRTLAAIRREITFYVLSPNGNLKRIEKPFGVGVKKSLLDNRPGQQLLARKDASRNPYIV